MSNNALCFVDIGANLLHERYQGIYHGISRHEPDLDLVMQRAKESGVDRILVTAGTIDESRQAVAACRQWKVDYPDMHFACTVGVHPTRCSQVFCCGDNDKTTTTTDPSALLQELVAIAMEGMTDGTVVAIGEIGLDYDRLEFCPKHIQLEYFARQLQVLGRATKLPLFLHNRNVGTDLYNVLREHADCWQASGGVVHSFDDTIELAQLFINDLGLYIGLNGCSLRTEASLTVAKDLPLNRILLETDCPFCDVRKTHAGYPYVQTQFEAKAEKKYERGKLVKNRQEPCHVIQVAEIIAGVKNVDLQVVADACYENALQLLQWR